MGLVANRIASERQAEAILQFAEQQHLKVIAQVPFDPMVVETGMTGAPLDHTSSRAIMAIDDLANHLWELS